ncbi:hypothetical protein ACO0LO_10575 [Undibacterium sp. TJN25]|uniref:hypothetical protein n=1 Tax=Undibacterium sp. TJN25 TaxID=3413056 RepID=UPI003BF1152B
MIVDFSNAIPISGFRMRLKFMVGLGALAAISGCANVSNVNSMEGFLPTVEESILVLGVPQGYKVSLGPGNYVGYKWTQEKPEFDTSNTPSENGFVIVKIPARTGQKTYGLVSITPITNDLIPKKLHACNGLEMLTFEAEPGKISYVGDIQIAKDGNIEMIGTASKVRLKYSWNPDRAVDYLKSRYGFAASRLENKEATVIQRSGHAPLFGRCFIG